MNTDPTELQHGINNAADMLIVIMTDKFSTTQPELFADWREWFTAAMKHPRDPYPARRSEETTRELFANLRAAVADAPADPATGTAWRLK